MGCSSLCQRYLCIVNCFVILLGLLLQAGAVVLLANDPLNSGIDMMDLRGVYEVRQDKVVLFVVGLLLLFAGIMGIKFSKTGDCCIGLLYIIGLLGALVCYFELCYAFFELSKQLQELTAANEGKDPKDVLDDSKRSMMAKIFATFATRFTGRAYKCVLQRPTQFTVARALTSVDRCDLDKTIKCAANPPVGDFMTSYCMAPDGSEGEFSNQCDGCLNHFYQTWVAGSSYEKTHTPKSPTIKDMMASDSGMAFCRCMGRLLTDGSRWSTFFVIGAIALAVILALLALSAIWVVCFGVEEDDYDEELPEQKVVPYGGRDDARGLELAPANWR